jgi:hypothetical protein
MKMSDLRTIPASLSRNDGFTHFPSLISLSFRRLPELAAFADILVYADAIGSSFLGP